MQSKLVTDLHPLDQPEGTYRYALNAVSETSEGDSGRVSNERGTKLCTSLPAAFVGEVYTANGEWAVFLADNSIGIVKDCQYTQVLQDDSLNFNVDFPVDATYRLRRGCEPTVYFTDGNNPPKVVNLQSAEVEKLSKDFQRATLNADVRDGGILDVGAYYISIQYLDADDNPSFFFSSVGPIVLQKGTIRGPFTDIEGAFTSEADPINGVTNSNKSLVITATDLDENFSRYRLAIGVATASTGSITQVYYTQAFDIGQRQITISSLTGLATTTIEDVAVDPVIISSAEHIEQLENRLILANFKEKERNWEAYQRAANQITSKWTVESIPIKSYVPKNAKYHDQDLKGYMGGEAYVFGIVYVFQDGSESPAFITSPREATPYDLDQFVVTNTTDLANNTVALSDVQYLGVELGDSVSRWQFMSTADPITKDFGYHEGELTYPNTTDCSGQNFIWGDLAGEKVRYHVFPDRSTFPHVTQDVTNVFGVEFDNVVYPDPEIVGHYFVTARKQNFLVAGTGYAYYTETETRNNLPDLIRVSANGDTNINPSPQDITGSVINLITPEYFHNRALEFNYLRTNLKVTPADVVQFDSVRFEDTALDDDILVRYRYARLNHQHDSDYFTNRTIAERVFVPAGGQEFSGTDSVILSYKNNPAELLYLQDNVTFRQRDFHYVQLRNNVDPFPSYFNLQFRSISPLLNIGDSQKCLGGDTFISEMHLNLMEEQETVFGPAGEILSYSVTGNLYSGLFFETRINTSLGVSIDQDCFKKFDPSINYLQPVGNYREGLDYVVDYILTEDLEFATSCVDTYTVNPDFFSQDQLRFYNTLPNNFDYCESCRGQYKNRIAWSSQSFQEERVDNYRTFLANNYKDIESETGEITDLARYNDILYIVTDDAIWYQPASVQERTSNSGLISYVGTGSFLDLPEKRISNYDRIGKINKWGTINTPYGLIMTDSTNGDVYLVNQSLQNINEGISEELRVKMGNKLEEFLSFKHTYQYGVTAAYDEVHDRLLLTYKDFDIVGSWGGVVESVDDIYNTLFYDGQFFYNDPGFGRFNVRLGESPFFEDRSFTISYSFTGGWTSYHSYIPDFYLYGKDKVLSGKNNNLWKHNTGEFLVYYGTRFPHIVEPVYKSSGRNVWDSVDFISYASKDGVDQRWETFGQMVAYNSYQSTSLQPLIPKNIIEGSDYLINAIQEGYYLDELGEVWHINGLRDEVANYETPLFIQSQDLRQTDKVPNILAFTGKEWYETEPLRDQYLILRLIYQGSAKLTTLYAQVRNRG